MFYFVFAFDFCFCCLFVCFLLLLLLLLLFLNEYVTMNFSERPGINSLSFNFFFPPANRIPNTVNSRLEGTLL